MKTRVLLADDHEIVRQGLRSLIAGMAGIDVVAEAGNGRTTVQLALKLTPDIVIMDIGMPELNGVDATRQIRAGNPRIKVIALSMHADERFVAGMLDAGASGYLLKDAAFEELANALQAVAAGQTYLSPRIARVVIDSYLRSRAGDAGAARPALSPREREVLQLVAEGWSTKRIADTLHLGTKTVETHRKRIMDRLGIHSIAELTKYALREGLTSP